jgi:hypothetical protein
MYSSRGFPNAALKTHNSNNHGKDCTAPITELT